MTRKRVTLLAAGGVENLDHTATVCLRQWQCQPSAVSAIGRLAGRLSSHLRLRTTWPVATSQTRSSAARDSLDRVPERARDSPAVGAKDDLMQ